MASLVLKRQRSVLFTMTVGITLLLLSFPREQAPKVLLSESEPECAPWLIQNNPGCAPCCRRSGRLRSASRGTSIYLWAPLAPPRLAPHEICRGAPRRDVLRGKELNLHQRAMYRPGLRPGRRRQPASPNHRHPYGRARNVPPSFDTYSPLIRRQILRHY